MEYRRAKDAPCCLLDMCLLESTTWQNAHVEKYRDDWLISYKQTLPATFCSGIHMRRNSNWCSPSDPDPRWRWPWRWYAEDIRAASCPLDQSSSDLLFLSSHLTNTNVRYSTRAIAILAWLKTKENIFEWIKYKKENNEHTNTLRVGSLPIGIWGFSANVVE